jgi:hypothetical protein
VAKYHGRDGVVYLATTGAGTATNVVSLNRWSLDLQQDREETTSFGATNKTYVAGLRDVQGELEGFYDETETKPWTAATSATGCYLFLYPSSSAVTKFAGGPAWLDMSIETPIDGPVSISGSFGANGSWTISL